LVLALRGRGVAGSLHPGLLVVMHRQTTEKGALGAFLISADGFYCPFAMPVGWIQSIQ